MFNKEEIKNIYPLTPMQRGMLHHALLAPMSSAYHEQLILRFDGTLNVSLLEQSWQEVIDSHDALRGRIVNSRVSNPVQVVPHREPLQWAIHSIESNLQAFGNDALPHDVQMFLVDDLTQPFDLESSHPMRFTLFRGNEERHWLVWSFHHILLDGWSIGIVLDQVLALYNAKSRDVQPAALPVCHYTDYQRWLSTRDKSKALSYWKGHAADFSGAALVSSESAGHLSHVAKTRLSLDVTHRLRAFAQSQRASMHHLLLCAWGITVGNHLDQRDVIVPTVLAGRPEAIEHIDRLTGLLINTVPMRVHWQGNECFADVLQRVRDDSLAASEHQYLSLAEIQEATGKLPIDHVLLVQGMPYQQVVGIRCGDAAVGWVDFRESIPYALEVSLIPSEQSIDIVLSGNREQTWLQALVDGMLCVLTAMAREPQMRLCDMAFVNPQQQAQLLSWGDGGPSTTPQTLLQLIDAQSARTPDAEALVCDDETLTYRELNQRANRLAHTLLADGPLPPDTPIALVSQRNAELVIGLLAILRAGAAYVPVDPEFPAERIRLMCEASGCKRLLVSSAFIDRLPTLPNATVIRVDRIADNIPDTPPISTITPDDLAYIIFTSGSTGTPKGTMLRHRNVAAFFESLPQVFGFAPGNRIAAVTTVSFDIAALELLGALTCGMTIVLASHEQAKDPMQLLALIERENVDTLQMTPTRLRLLLDTIASQAESGVLPSVHTLLVGGEALPQTLADQLRQLTHIKTFNVYGPTETTIWSAYWQLAPGPVSIGRAFPGERLFVLSAQYRLQPPGAIGEIAIAGVGVARGYLNDETRTSERFITVPGIDGPVYLTGDVGRWHHDGRLECLGRRDDQIKIRGMRIEIGEIEHHLQQLPQVRDAAAKVRKSAIGEAEIVAYLVGPAAIDTGEIRTQLAAILPPAMIPAHFVSLPALPQTPNGKTDRRALPDPVTSTVNRQSREPNGPAEAAITRVFSEILGHAVGPDDDFFMSGGHSLKAIYAIGRVNRELSSGYTLRDLYRAPTASRLANTAPSHAAPVTRAPNLDNYPLSYAQQALWILDQMHPGYSGYNVPGSYWIEGELDSRAFSRAWMALVKRHESLRTVFRTVDGVPRQHVLETMEFSMEHSMTTAENLEARIAELTCRPFDLVNGPLFRIALISLDAQRHVLLMITHHIISDGWSDAILVEDLAVAYRAAINDKDPQTTLPPPSAITYRDFAVWQQTYFTSSFATSHQDYWRKRLRDLPELQLPTDYPRVPTRIRRGARMEMQLQSSDGREWLTAVPAQRRYATFAAAVLTLLHIESGQTDLIVGLPIANRERPELQTQVGLHLNTLPLRKQLRTDISLQALVDDCANEIAAAMAHADYPFARLVDDLGITAQPGRHPVFDAMLIFHQQPVPVPRLDGVDVSLHDQRSYTSRFDVDFEVWASDNGVHGFIEYDTGLFTAARAAGFSERWHTILLHFAQQPSITLAQLRQEMSGHGNETADYLSRALALNEEF